MTLIHTSLGRSRVLFAATFPALLLMGCGGDPFIGVDDVPVDQVGVGAASPSAGAAAQVTGAQPGSAGSISAGGAGSADGAGGAASSTITIEPSGVGVEPASAGEAPLGAGGEPAQQPVRALELIDDVEGAFPNLPAKAGRNGAWYTAHDDSYGLLKPANAVALQPARGDSRFAAELSGSGFTGWGAQLGVSLTAPANGYDASAYCGLRFLAKGTGSGWALLISDRQSVPQGGVCNPDAWDGESACYHFSGKGFEVGSEWQEVVIRFDELKILVEPQNLRALDASAIFDIIFNVRTADGGAFQLLVDDLAFIKESPAGCQ